MNFWQDENQHALITLLKLYQKEIKNQEFNYFSCWRVGKEVFVLVETIIWGHENIILEPQDYIRCWTLNN